MQQQMSASSSSGRETRKGDDFPETRSSGSHILISFLPKRPGDTLLIATILQGQELKALCGTFNDLR